MMRRMVGAALLLLLCAVALRSGDAQVRESYAPAHEAPRPAEHGVVDFLAPIEADPVLQHSKEIYVLYGCAYCHGVNLRTRNGEAADLLHSALVGADVNGNLIGAVLKNGIPQTAKLSPMPQFSDLSEAEMQDIARWVHYARMQARTEELMRVPLPMGDVAAGKAMYGTACAACHAPAAMTSMVKKTGVAALEGRLLKPALVTAVVSYKVGDSDDAARVAARTKHSLFTENVSAQDVANLVAYLKMLQ